MYVIDLKNNISIVAIIEIIKDKKIHMMVNFGEPEDPNCLPKNPAKHEPNIGKKSNNKYMYFRKNRI